MELLNSNTTNDNMLTEPVENLVDLPKLESPDILLNKYTEVDNTSLELVKKIVEFKEAHKDIFDQLEKYNDELSAIDEQLNSIKLDLTELMCTNNIKKLENNRFKVTYVAETERDKFDKDTFKKEIEELYNKYVIKTMLLKHQLSTI